MEAARRSRSRRLTAASISARQRAERCKKLLPRSPPPCSRKASFLPERSFFYNKHELLSHHRFDRAIQRPKDTKPVMRTKEVLACSLRVRHHAKHIPIKIADAGNVTAGAVGICLLGNLAVFVTVAKNDLIVFLEA